MLHERALLAQGRSVVRREGIPGPCPEKGAKHKRMNRYERRALTSQKDGILLPIVGMIAFTALGYFIGDSIQKTHSNEVKRQLELKVEKLERQLEYYQSEVGLASSLGEPDLMGRYRTTNESDPNQAPVSLQHLTWPLKYRPYFNQPISNRQD